MSPRWLIGMAMLFVILTICANVVEGQTEPLSASNLNDLELANESSITEASDPAGGVATFWTKSGSSLQMIGKIFTFDYAFFYDENGDPIGWAMLFRYICLIPLAMVIINLIVLLRQMFVR